jgi:rhodanese-related sulfurtransferase
MHRRILALALVAALVPIAASCGGDTTVEPRLETVDAAAFADAVDSAGTVVLDVRTPEEYAAGHVPGADNIDYYATSFRSRLDALDKDAAYAIYCRSGNRSADTLQIMTELGFTDVRELGGGIISWVEAGLPLEY